MANLQSYRRIYEQDFSQKDQELVRQLAVTLNASFEQIMDILNGKLTIADNLASKVKNVQLMVDATGKPTTKVTIPKPDSNQLSGVIVIRVDNLTNSSVYPTSGVFISFTETTDSVIVNNITGLKPNNSYSINVELLR